MKLKKRILAIFTAIALIIRIMVTFVPVVAATGDPGKIEAENYSAMSGIQVESCSEGGSNVGYTDAGDWMDYTLNVLTAGNYNIEFRVASPYTGTQLQILKGTTPLTTVTIPNTGGWQNWQTVATTLSLGAGVQTVRVKALSNGWNLNWINITSISQPTGKAIPGKIEAEGYNTMLGVATQDCSEGTLNVGWIDTGDYMNYDVSVASAGTYTVEYRISSPNATGQLQLKSLNNILSTTILPNTGGWQSWKTVTTTVALNAGNQTLTLYAGVGGFNLNWINFIQGTSMPQVAPPTFTPAGGTYATAQNITLACATTGSTIKYTTDGSTPTATSATYSTAIPIATTTSVKAIATKSGMVDSELATATYKIGSSNGVMDFQIQNGTRGNYTDSQIYWAVLGLNAQNKLCYLDANGALIPTSTALNDATGHLTKNGQNYANIYHSISEKPLVSTPAISSGRMFLSVGSPCYIKIYDNGYAGPDVNNITDPNNDIYWDFVEFTLDAGGYHGNTTRVDAFGFPITHRLICADGYDKTVGETETRSALFTEYQNEVPEAFKTLVKAPYRILAPCKGEFKTGGLYANYFDAYVNQYWHETTAKPTTQDILLGIGGASDPKICAALNRGVYMDPTHWADANYFYKITPSNFYSKFWHDHSIDGRSYGFCYDDVNDKAAYLEHNNPTALVITVGW